MNTRTRPSANGREKPRMSSSLRLAPLVPDDLAQELPRPLLPRRLEEPSRGRVLNDAPFVHEHHPVRGLAGEPDLVRDHEHGHSFTREVAHDVEHLTDHLG